MDVVADKREKEKQIVSLMIEIYCKKQHKSKKGLCDQCENLDNYAKQRTDRCPFMQTKTFCSNCQVHCYKPEMRKKIREVMCFSGPRMMLHHPVIAIKHLIESTKEKRELETQKKIGETK